ncbi:MAG: thiamine phosphate synthase [Alteraurantiacibacter sp. bin_em_oilr2.035]|uniref:thiamine phosphate synthase n=1 Tax=Aurantiacibacter atlanticus TaxID=1648404 RepID=UPI00065F5943|nr:thiamine phosphate synthase [Aurantiacibacter atlanticus]MDF1834269.1 thiamine phosphate synthase [Alteraurantiacibacter sp. bin_em_oilr2.035]
MTAFQSLPRLWLISDERNDGDLDAALAHMPAGSALVFRHYHLAPTDRFARFAALGRIARRAGHIVIIADSAQTAAEWGADGIYGAPLALAPRRAGLLAIATAHNMGEIAQANRAGADAVMVSPVFPTRSHPDAGALGLQRFRTLASHAQMPVVALGGMNAARAKRLNWPCWAAIDGICATWAG